MRSNQESNKIIFQIEIILFYFSRFLLLYKKDVTKRRETYESIYDSFVTMAAA
jgi:hypothetical protein